MKSLICFCNWKKKNLFEKYRSTRPDSWPVWSTNPIDPIQTRPDPEWPFYHVVREIAVWVEFAWPNEETRFFRPWGPTQNPLGLKYYTSPHLNPSPNSKAISFYSLSPIWIKTLNHITNTSKSQSKFINQPPKNQTRTVTSTSPIWNTPSSSPSNFRRETLGPLLQNSIQSKPTQGLKGPKPIQI